MIYYNIATKVKLVQFGNLFINIADVSDQSVSLYWPVDEGLTY